MLNAHLLYSDSAANSIMIRNYILIRFSKTYKALSFFTSVGTTRGQGIIRVVFWKIFKVN